MELEEDKMSKVRANLERANERFATFSTTKNWNEEVEALAMVETFKDDPEMFRWGLYSWALEFIRGRGREYAATTPVFMIERDHLAQEVSLTELRDAAELEQVLAQRYRWERSQKRASHRGHDRKRKSNNGRWKASPVPGARRQRDAH